MESAPLNKAHEHVRNAATATYGNSIAAAGAEHELAASAFHNAAHDTHNDEALRILALLEDHHHKLARLIKEPPRKKEKSDGPEQASESSSTSPPAIRTSARASSPSPSTSSPSRAPSRRRLPQSSIASNLAEKRGIPGSRRGTSTVSPVSVTNALGTCNETPSTPVRDLLERQSRKASSSSARNERPEETAVTRPNVSPPSDDNFRRFYSAFGGVISAISAPLAFTSLPLTLPTPTPPAEPTPPPPEKNSRSKSPEASRTIKSSEPDISALISKPALRALREDNAVTLGPFANNESFYFVPTSGGTVSYANIVRDPQAHPHHVAQNPHLDSIDENENESGLCGSSHEEFVDARESINPPSPTAPRRPRSKGSTSSVTTARTIPAGRGTGQKTMEELALENETLRNLIDKQAKRLSMWETTSQSSYNALAQSFRARGGGLGSKQLSDPSALAQALAMGSNAVPPALPSPPIVSLTSQYQTQPQPHSPLPPTDRERQRIAELEALLASQATHVSALESEKQQLMHTNEKHAQVIGRYREQWEKLKAGARKKEQERREKRVEQVKKGEGTLKDSESGEATGEEVLEEEPGFGKA